MTDFFISYTGADLPYAEWIGWVLEEARFSVVIQAWDFRPGSNFVLEMQAATAADRTILVLSEDYLESAFAAPEWAAAFRKDPQGFAQKLLPIMVKPCSPEGLLGPIVYLSIVGQDEAKAQETLLKGVDRGRAKPAQRPAFPGGSTSVPHKAFPGPAAPAVPTPQPYVPKMRRAITDVDKRRFSLEAFEAIKALFAAGLEQLKARGTGVDFDIREKSATDVTVEVFVDGKSINSCRLRLGGMGSSDNICYGEGHLFEGSDACNEILSPTEVDNELVLDAVMAMGFSGLGKEFDFKRLSQDEAADYMWRRFVSALERRR